MEHHFVAIQSLLMGLWCPISDRMHYVKFLGLIPVCALVVVLDEDDAAHGNASAEQEIEVGHSRGREELGGVVDGGAGAGDGGEAGGAALHEGAAPRFGHVGVGRRAEGFVFGVVARISSSDFRKIPCPK